MHARNTDRRYGWVTIAFHWSTAVLILTLIPLGLIASEMAHQIQASGGSDAFVARTTTLFSIHKTLGVAVFFIALARIAWALSQPKPAPIHPDRRRETFLADLVHWLLYASLVLVPLSGWLHHAATTGYAPIWLFPDRLPLVPQSVEVANFFGAWHWVFTKVLALAVFLHVAGAIKHAVIDRDGTLARMLGRPAAAPRLAGHGWAPIGVAVAVWALAVGAGTALGLGGDRAVASVDLAAAEGGNWEVTDGTLGITVVQMGSEVAGNFGTWTAEITFDEGAGPTYGEVRAVIAVPSLTLGGITDQALAAPFLQAESFPEAVYRGPIVDAPEGAEAAYMIDGTLSLIGAEASVPLLFDLQIDGDAATATGRAEVDREDVGMALQEYPNGDTVSLLVGVTLELTAQRAD